MRSSACNPQSIAPFSLPALPSSLASCSPPQRGPSNRRCRKPAKFRLNPAATLAAVAIQGRAARRATRFMMITACRNVPRAICVIPAIPACACRPAIMAVRKDMIIYRYRIVRRAITATFAIPTNACLTQHDISRQLPGRPELFAGNRAVFAGLPGGNLSGGKRPVPQLL